MTRRVSDAVTLAANLTGLSSGEIIGTYRFKHIAHVRFAVCLVAYEWGIHSLSQIGAVLGGRDHTTIINALQQARELEERNPKYARFLQDLRNACDEASPFVIERPIAPRIITPTPPRRGTSPLRPIITDDMDENDSGRKFHEGIAKGSAKLIAGLAA